ncbi:MAG: outer membrane homotrimeric porin [Desulfovibrio sp.]|nr:outer membrane homotrimeric porin [Desulfovibrio sp.]
MKKLATLILAAGLVCGASTGASAIDFKAKGQWIMNFAYGDGGNFVGGYKNQNSIGWGGGRDNFEASQRVRLQLDAVASETLSGTVYFEIGQSWWGQGGNNQGAALGADGRSVIKLKQAYIDWMIPESDVKVRMGIQNVSLPSYTIGSSTVMDDDAAGVVVNGQVNDMVGITAMWFRPFNDNYGGQGVDGWGGHTSDWRAGYMDNMDAFALLVPITLDGARVTPWGMYATIGPNTFRGGDRITRTSDRPHNPNGYYPDYFGDVNPGPATGYAQMGLFPVAGSRHKDFSPAASKLSNPANAWWGGVTGDITAFDPFRIAFDFTYGSVEWQDNGRLNRQGWLASLLFEYKLDWAIPGLYGWYGSGDDNNPSNGSERLPTISANNTNQFSTFAFNGDPYIARDGVISSGNMGGTWGVGIRLKDMRFIENLKHTFRINYMGGTNSPTMGKKMSLNGLWFNGNTLDGSYTTGVGGFTNATPTGIVTGSSAMGIDSTYLTTMDQALEFGLTNRYKMYENFTVTLEMDYVALFLDTSSSVWGARHKINQSIPSTKDAWNINASFVYQF